MSAASIRRLSVSNFRNYRAASLDVGAPMVVLTGANGAGKTNLLEAISFFVPGRGLRRATLEEVTFNESDDGTEGLRGAFWAVSAEIEGALGLATLGTGIEPSTGGESVTRKCRIDREPVGSASAFADHLRVIWMTPAMDGLFSGPASERRRFLDRLVLAVDAEHPGRVSALERALRSRNRLLEERQPDSHWLDAIEHETAELAIAVAAARVETLQRLQGALARGREIDPVFPFAEIALAGWMEEALLQNPAGEVEDRYRALLRDNRARDAAAGRTLDGPHRSDLSVSYGPKAIAAANASTGEQKAVLIRLILAHAHLITEMTGFSPILLLDEIVAHLDPARRTALYDSLERSGAQVWMTGADPQAFAEIAGRADLFEVRTGEIFRRDFTR